MAKPAETPGEIIFAPVVELGTTMADAWRRSGCRGSSPLLLGLTERKARVSGAEGEEKEKKASAFEGGERFLECGTEKKGKWEI